MQTKINPVYLASVQSIELNYKLASLNQVSMQTAERWIRTNDKNLLVYPNLILILEEINKSINANLKDKNFTIPDILINLNH